MEKLRRENEQLKKLREEERLKRSQEIEQHNDRGCVTSPQGGTLVVRDLIDITRRMKQQLGQTLIKETQIQMETREVTETRKEIEQHNDRGCVTSPEGGTLVVRDLIDINRRMKQRLGQTLIKETQIKMETREVTKTKRKLKYCQRHGR